MTHASYMTLMRNVFPDHVPCHSPGCVEKSGSGLTPLIGHKAVRALSTPRRFPWMTATNTLLLWTNTPNLYTVGTQPDCYISIHEAMSL